MSEDIRGEDDYDRRPRRRRAEGDDEPPRRRRRRDDDDEEPAKGSGSLLMWLLIGGGAFLFFCVGGGLVLYFPVRAKMRESNERVVGTNNLRQIGLAFHNFHDMRGALPQDILGPDGKALLSWRVAILPYIEQDSLYRQFKLDEPWDGPNNSRLLSQMPATYRLPYRDKADEGSRGRTFYQGFAGRGSVFDPGNPRLRLTEITDGTSNTILVVEAPDAVEWTKPGGVPFDPNGPPPRMRDHSGGVFRALYCDGSVRAVRPRIDQDFDFRLKAAIGRADGIVAPELD